MKKALLLFTTGILVCALAVSAGAAVEIDFWAMTNAPSDQHYAWMTEKTAEFEAETGIKVRFEEIGWDEIMTRAAAAIITGEGAHVFQLGTTQNPYFAGTGGLEQINIDEFGGADSFFDANLLSTTLDGKNYGVPWFAETRALFFNTDMLAQAGVEPPTTYLELVEVGQKIIETFGMGTAIATAGTNAWDLIHNWAIILWAYGGDMLTPDAAQAAFNSEAGEKAMNYWVNLVASGLADRACAEYNQPQADAAFINGDAAMCFMGPWNIAGIEADNPSLPYDIVEPPAGPFGRASFSGGSNLVIRNNASKQEIEAAKAWVQFLLRPDILADYTKNLSKFLPANKEALQDPYYETGVWATFVKTLGYATAYPPLVEWGEIEGTVQTNFGNVLADYVDGKYDQNSAQKYLDTAAAEVNAILKK